MSKNRVRILIGVLCLIAIGAVIAGCEVEAVKEAKPITEQSKPIAQRQAEVTAEHAVKPALIPDSQIPDAAAYAGSIKNETEPIALSSVEVQNDHPLKALAHVNIGGQPKRAVLVLTGYGSFEWNRTPSAKDPIFNMTMPTSGDWHIVKGIGRDSQKQGSWVFIYPADGPFIEELALPLSELKVTSDGKLAVMKFSAPERTLVFYVPSRMDEKPAQPTDKEPMAQGQNVQQPSASWKKAPYNISVVEATATEKSQVFVTGMAIIDNVPKREAENIKPKEGYVFLIVKFVLSDFTNPDKGVTVSTDDVRFIGKDGNKEKPFFESFYEDSTGKNQFAWSKVTDSITLPKGAESALQVVFIVKADQLKNCKVRIFDKHLLVSVKNE